MRIKKIDQELLKKEGRYGRDNDNLSWSKQRKLCLDRDQNRCTICGHRPSSKEKPLECHHKIPFRYSHSHKLSNLQTVCYACHRKLDSEVDKKTFDTVPYVRVRGVKPCKNCGSRGRKLHNGFCNKCIPEVYKLRVLDMYRNEWKVQEISKELGISQSFVYKIVREYQ